MPVIWRYSQLEDQLVGRYDLGRVKFSSLGGNWKNTCIRWGYLLTSAAVVRGAGIEPRRPNQMHRGAPSEMYLARNHHNHTTANPKPP